MSLSERVKPKEPPRRDTRPEWVKRAEERRLPAKEMA